MPISPELVPQTLFSRRKFWAERFGVAPVLPTTRAEMDELGWDSCDVILVTGDAYVDHPSFGMALVGRLLEAQGFRVGIMSQPDWRDVEAFRALGRPTVMWGVTAGNMDSMVNRYTSDRRLRHDDAYSPGGAGGKRPDRALIVYAQRCREAFADVPVVIGGIEGSLRRIAHYDYWSNKVRRSILIDSRADLLVYGNGERAVVEIAHRLAAGEAPDAITDLRGTAFSRPAGTRRGDGWTEIDSTTIDTPGPTAAPVDPYAMSRPSERRTPPARRRHRRRWIRPARQPAAARRPRALGGAHARLRHRRGGSDAVRARVAHPARRVESGQRARAGPASRRP